MNFITSKIAIGDSIDAQDIPALRSAGIRSILCLNGQLDGLSAGDMGLDALRVFTLADGTYSDPTEFHDAVEAVAELSSSHPRLLVHCTEGRSRSVMVVAAHLMRTKRMSAKKAINSIRDERPQILPTEELLANWKLNGQGKLMG